MAVSARTDLTVAQRPVSDVYHSVMLSILPLQLEAEDAETKDPSGANTELKRSPFKEGRKRGSLSPH